MSGKRRKNDGDKAAKAEKRKAQHAAERLAKQEARKNLSLDGGLEELRNDDDLKPGLEEDDVFELEGVKESLPPVNEDVDSVAEEPSEDEVLLDENEEGSLAGSEDSIPVSGDEAVDDEDDGVSSIEDGDEDLTLVEEGDDGEGVPDETEVDVEESVVEVQSVESVPRIVNVDFKQESDSEPVDVVDDGLDGSEMPQDGSGESVEGSFEGGDNDGSDGLLDPLDDESAFVQDPNADFEGFEPSEPADTKPKDEVTEPEDADFEKFDGLDTDVEAFDGSDVDDDLTFLTDEEIYEQESLGKDLLFSIDNDEVPEDVQVDETMAEVPEDGLTEEVVREQVEKKKKKGFFSRFGKKNDGFEIPEQKLEEQKSEDESVDDDSIFVPDDETLVETSVETESDVDSDADADTKNGETEESVEKPVKLTRAERKEQRKHDLEVLKADRAAYKANKKGKPVEKSETNDEKEKVKPEKVETETPAVPKKKKKKNGMAQVLSESVIEAVWPDFVENEQFTMERDGETVGIAMFFDTNTIGGFTKKSRNDEVKGSIIEAITSGMLKHLLTEKLMDDECIVFIPCTESMSVIMEHSILYNAQYTICFVYEDGSVELTDVVVTAREIEELIRDERDVSVWLLDKMPEDEVEEMQVEEAFSDDDEEEDEQAGEAGYQPETFSDDDYIDDDDDDDSVDFGHREDPEQVPEYDDTYDDGSNDQPVYDDESEYIDEDDGEEEKEVIPYDAITETVVKTFYPTDLDLKVSTEPFDGRFIHSNPYIPFEEQRATKYDDHDTYMDTVIGELVKDCNTQLRSLHETNLFKLRSDYFNLVSMACTRIAEGLDINDPDTEVGQLQIALDENYEERKANLENAIQSEKERLNKEWHEKVEKAAADAAEMARRSYTERYRRQHDDMIAHVQPNLTEQLETDYKTENQKIHDKRRHDAEVLLNEYVEKILDKLNILYQKMLDEENDLRTRFRDELRNHVEEHRKSEFARSQALAEELSQVTKADIVRREMSAEVDKIRASFAADREQWLSQTEATQAQHMEELRKRDQLFENTVQEMTTEKQHLEGTIETLNKKLDTLSDVKDKEYKSRVTQLENEALSWKSELEHQRAKHRKQTIITGALAIIAILAALSIGFIGGAYVNLKADRVSTTQSLFDEIDERLVESSLIESED